MRSQVSLTQALARVTITAVLVWILVACGGGGGGGGDSGAANIAPVANAGALQNVVAGTQVTLNGSASDANGDSLTYAWTLTSKPAGSAAALSSATSPTPTFRADIAGTYVATLVVNDGKVDSSPSAVTVTVINPLPPAPPGISVIPAAPVAGTSVGLTATSIDPNGQSLTFLWNFGDGSPTASGASVAHSFAAAGSYTVRATATNTSGLSASSSITLNVAYPNPNPPTLTSSITSAYTGQSIRFDGAATDPSNLPLTYSWNFGDGAGASGSSVTHTYTSASTYTVTLTVMNSAGGTSSGTISQGVLSTAANTFVPDCAGLNCAASGSNTYSGSGTGIWRYSNSTTVGTTINVSIGGVSQGKTVTLLFSNGSNAVASSVPNPGILAMPLAAPVALQAKAPAVSSGANLRERHDAAHSRVLADNVKVARSLLALGPIRSSAMALADAGLAPLQTMSAPALYTARMWNDLYGGTQTPYATTVQAVCPVANGRNAVIWVDPNAQASGKVTLSNITSFANTVCGGNGGFSQLVALLGDVWGSSAASYSYLIQDSPLQDINIVIVNAPASTDWAGYFSTANSFKAASLPGSNEALVFFINADQVQSNLNYSLSSLIHEATHMINFYQRTVVRHVSHDTWLEETTAMMSEDIVSPTVVKNADGSGYDAMAEERVPDYLQTGGAVSYINWLSSSPSYAIAGSFGAYVNRQYGLSIYRQLLSGCITGITSYMCLDTLIKNNGGLGFADEFAHFGATIFAALPPTGMPAFYGYRAKTDSGYSLLPIDVSASAFLRPTTAAALVSGYTATTHTYQVDTVPAGKTTYIRNGVIVPANTTLIVVVK